jgi:hypothetical protein
MRSATFSLLFFIVCAVISEASVPMHKLNYHSFGFDYSARFIGQTADNAVTSQLRLHHLTLHYAPVPYMMFSAGLGLNTFEVEENDLFAIENQLKFSSGAALTLATPKLLSVVGLVAGCDAFYINSKYYRGGLYTPSVGVDILCGKYFDITGGVKGHFVGGSMSADSGVGNDVSKAYPLRGFGAFTLHSAEGNEYLSVGIDMSPNMSSGWQRGPIEASIICKVGFLIHFERTAKKKERDYFPEYEALKKKQGKMSEELQ